MDVGYGVKRTEGRLLILKTNNDDWKVAQRAVAEEDQAARPKRIFERLSFSESESESSMPKRLLDEHNTVSRFSSFIFQAKFQFLISGNFFFFLLMRDFVPCVFWVLPRKKLLCCLWLKVLPLCIFYGF